jgi:hypothetical protein
MKKILIIAIVIGIIIAGYFFFYPKPGNKNIVDSPQNATYIIENIAVKLNNGRLETEISPGSASKTVTQYFGNEAKADLNGDGLVDSVFLLTQNNGGSGTFFYVVAALATDEGYKGTNAVLLGDRIAPQTTEIRDGEIIVNYAERNLGEDMTSQPSVGVSKYLKLEEGKLVEIIK